MELHEIIESIGLLGIAIAVFAESGLFLGAFLPGDSLLFTAGFLASQDIIDIRLLIPLCFVAAVIGDSFGYAFGRTVGPLLFKRDDSLLFHRDHLKRAQRFYDKHGGKTIVIARFLPIVRTFAPILAGMGHMHYPRFLVFNVVGALLWAVGLILTGYTLGNSIPGIDRYLLPILLLIILTSIAPTLFHILKDKTYRSSLLAQIKKLSRGKQGDAREKLSTPVPPSEVSAFQTIARQGGHGSPDTSGESPAEALSADRPLGRSSVSGHADIERSTRLSIRADRANKITIPQDYHNTDLTWTRHVIPLESYSEQAKVAFIKRFHDKPWFTTDVSLRLKTTMRLGGPADFFLTPKTLEDAQAAIKACQDLSIPLFVLGGGSNILFSNSGWRGVVLQPANTNITINQSVLSSGPFPAQTPSQSPPSKGGDATVSPSYEGGAEGRSTRWETTNPNRPTPPKKPEIPSRLPVVEVTVGAGTSLQQLIINTHQQRLVGLESFFGIPARVGGALRNNVHGGPDNFDRYIKEATLINLATGNTEIWPEEKFGFSYDHSALQQSREWLVWEVVLILPHVDNTVWQDFDVFYKTWQVYKNATQTAAGTAGCVFKNILPDIAQQKNAPISAGALIDQMFGLGATLRTAQVSTWHGNFLQNINAQSFGAFGSHSGHSDRTLPARGDPNLRIHPNSPNSELTLGSSADMLSLINFVREEVQRRTAITLELEIELVGF